MILLKILRVLDRVVTIAQFGKLNEIYLYDQISGKLKRGSFFFQEQEWKTSEMADIGYNIASRSIYHYFSKYGKDKFI